MISFALLLMTLPSRVAEVRAERAVRGELLNSSREEAGWSGVRLDNTKSAARENASADRIDRYDKEQ